MDKVVICVRRRLHDYIAYVEGKSDHPNVGKTIEEAVGKLVTYHPEYFNIKLTYPD